MRLIDNSGDLMAGFRREPLDKLAHCSIADESYLHKVISTQSNERHNEGLTDLSGLLSQPPNEIDVQLDRSFQIALQDEFVLCVSNEY